VPGLSRAAHRSCRFGVRAADLSHYGEGPAHECQWLPLSRQSGKRLAAALRPARPTQPLGRNVEAEREEQPARAVRLVHGRS
jgi:hypothetical protein